MSDLMRLITAQFNPISLEEINRRASLQIRADNKYFLSLDMFKVFANLLVETHDIMEIDGQRAFTYDTQYFDTPGLSNYWSHVQKRRKRFKCRSRKYVDNDLHFFEVKLKGGRGQTVKHKINYSSLEWGAVTPVAASFVGEQLQDFYGMSLADPLIPTLRNTYRRVTLAAIESTERITCDFDIAFGTSAEWQGRMDERYVLIETKSERGRGRADQLLWRMGARPTSGSKYCLGLSLLNPHLRSNHFHQIRKTYFIRNVEPAPEEQLRSIAVGETIDYPNTPVDKPRSLPSFGAAVFK